MTIGRYVSLLTGLDILLSFVELLYFLLVGVPDLRFCNYYHWEFFSLRPLLYLRFFEEEKTLRRE